MVQNLIIAGRSNKEIRHYLQENGHVSKIDDAWFYKIRSMEAVQDLFAHATLEAIQTGYTPRAKRLEILNAGVDTILRSTGVRMGDALGTHRDIECERSLTGESLSRDSTEREIPGSADGPITVSGNVSMISTTEKRTDQPENARYKREEFRDQLQAWAEIRKLLNQIRIEMAEYDGNIAAAVRPDPEDVEAMINAEVKRRLYALLEAMESEVENVDVVVVRRQRSVSQ